MPLLLLKIRAQNYMKFHVLNYWSENKETKYIYILRYGECNGTKTEGKEEEEVFLHSLLHNRPIRKSVI